MEENNKDTLLVDTADTNNNEDNNAGAKTFTQDEMDKIIAKRINEANKKAEEKFKKQLADEKAEIERVAKLNAEEREQEEKAKRERDLKAREDDITRREMSLHAKSLLNEKNVPTDLVEFVVDLDVEKTNNNVEKMVNIFNKAVEKIVNEKLKGKVLEDFTQDNKATEKSVISKAF